VERPSGPCWSFLAHLVAAIGAFTVGSDKAADNGLFAEVESLMNATYLENGKLTLVQALVLMSNYLQTKDKPNSGYNYMGAPCMNPHMLPMDGDFSMVWRDVYPIENFDESMMMQADFWNDLVPEGM
jgi:hypothetical protein